MQFCVFRVDVNGGFKTIHRHFEVVQVFEYVSEVFIGSFFN